MTLLDGVTRPAAQTDARGRYRVDGVAPGRHTVEARRTGFAPASRTVDVPGGGVATVDLALAPAVSTLATVTVIGTRSEVWPASSVRSIAGRSPTIWFATNGVSASRL